ncbi:ATP synthase F1 subunit delta [Candidatus Parcubacteria bacterium]|nr:MAG: ATP synthase F1 subunit delta [Candidatus Parcubacteria bacterium]
MKKDQAKILARGVYTAIAEKGKNEVESIVNNFLAYLKDHRLNFLIPSILEELENIYLDEKGIVKTTVSSKDKLAEKEVKQISDLVSQKSGKVVQVKETEDKDLIGGAVIRYEDKVIDLSIKKQLKNLAKQLAS